MKDSLLILAVALTSSSLMAQIKPQEMDIDISSFCEDQEQIDSSCLESEMNKVEDPFKDLMPMLTGKSSDAEKKKACEVIRKLSAEKTPPIEFQMKDDQDNPWKIKFHFGFNRTNIRPTDIKIRSSLVNTDFKDFEFDERTSAKHYNPKYWDSVGKAFRWIDEPSNTFALSIENKKNAIYLTAFHPKMLRTYYEDKFTSTYSPAAVYLSDGTPESYNTIPKGKNVLEIQNTHMLMNYQIGYGRKITLMDQKKAGTINYIVRADMGITTGEARTIYLSDETSQVENRDKPSIQGVNASIGHRLEYEKGKFGAFVEQKYNASTMKHGFLDGTAEYKLEYSVVHFGVKVDVLTLNKKEKIRKNRPKGIKDET